MAIEIVDFPIKNGDFPLQTVSSPEGNHSNHFFPCFLGSQPPGPFNARAPGTQRPGASETESRKPGSLLVENHKDTIYKDTINEN